MTYLIDRIDFVDNKLCEFCKRHLRTNIAYILIKDGIEVPAGPSCAKKNGKNSGEKIPDFTKASFDVPEDDEVDQVRDGANPVRGNIRARAPRPAGYHEVEYLRLRAEKLVRFNGAMFPKLKEIYLKYQTSGLDDTDITYLERLIKKVSADNPLLSPKNLQNCYAYAFWLERFLDKKGTNEFASSVLAQLQQKLKLTEAQIVAINNWFQHIERMPRLDTKAFL
ncbi:hypothetical protein [Undibacterium griseum]|uniref:Uncharacterized protein n=1 Tax=Undibacterium griseum TaxID=2762295 RepID=A0ABR6YP26_9BURK|nr:hypothetical protein [Undibacterium griseum]MBC3885647.1 hypothetical protein [Undibacterium griseum]